MKITKLLSVVLVAAVLGLAACSKSSDNNDANQTTLTTASASLGASVNIFPTALGSTTSNTTNPYVELAQDQFGAAVAGSGSFKFSTVFGLPTSLLAVVPPTVYQEITSIVNDGVSGFPTISGAGKPYTVFWANLDLTSLPGLSAVHNSAGGDSILNVAVQVYQSADSYLLEVLAPADANLTSWVALLVASEKKDQSSGALMGFTSNPQSPATSLTWTRSSDNTTVTYDALVTENGTTIQFSKGGISLTTTVAKNSAGLYATTAGNLTVLSLAVGGPSNASNIVVTWKADGTGAWSDPQQVVSGIYQINPALPAMGTF